MNEHFYNLVLQDKMTWDQLHDMLIKFNTAMAAAQAEIKTIGKTEKAHTWKYAPWPEIRSETIEAVAEKNGLAIEQWHTGEPDNMRLITRVRHSASGYEEIYESPLVFSRGARAGKLEHEVQGAITYYKRNTYNGLFCIATDEEDSENPSKSKEVSKQSAYTPDIDADLAQDKIDSKELSPCHKCGKPLIIRRNKATWGRFIACTGYKLDKSGCNYSKALD